MGISEKNETKAMHRITFKASINNNYLLTDSEVFTLKYQTEAFSKAKIWYFTVKTERSRLISSLLYGTFYYETQYNRD